MNFLINKVVLVTGAGGSIGSLLCNAILAREPARLVALDSSELALYNLQREHGSNAKLKLVLGDVSDSDDVRTLFAGDRIDVVYHAAAYKHVTFCENNPRVAWRVNLEGTARVANEARRRGVPTFVLISTDKAVHPISVMGKTKLAAEWLVTEMGYNVVRLGNVAGSSGSAIPLWREQISRDQPVTLTHPGATRFFISPGEAACAIIAASGIAQPGEVYVPDMGPPVSILQLARNMGAKQFDYVGLRPGEKMHEDLFEGIAVSTGQAGIYRDHVA